MDPLRPIGNNLAASPAWGAWYSTPMAGVAPAAATAAPAGPLQQASPLDSLTSMLLRLLLQLMSGQGGDAQQGAGGAQQAAGGGGQGGAQQAAAGGGGQGGARKAAGEKAGTGGAGAATAARQSDTSPGETVKGTAQAKGTGYYPANNAMEGGFQDRQGKKLYTLQDYLAGKAPYVSVAMDSKAAKYGTKLRIPELEKKYGRKIDFRVVDTGGAFQGKGKSRIDICTANEKASLDPTINGKLTLQFV